jgi:hypothetical protein
MRSPPVRALPRAAEAVGVVPWSRQARPTTLSLVAVLADEGIGHDILTGFGNDMEGDSRTMPANQKGSIENIVLPDCLNAGLMLMYRYTHNLQLLEGGML